MIEWVRVTASRLRAVFTKQRLDHDFDDELKHHLESLAEEYEAAGMSRYEARRAALLKLGHPELLREENRDYRGIPALETLARDFRFALRTLWKSPRLCVGRGPYHVTWDRHMQLPVQLLEWPGIAAAARGARSGAAGGVASPGSVPAFRALSRRERCHCGSRR